MKETHVNERRLIKVLVNYWERARKGAPMPVYASFNSGVLGEVWDSCLCVELQRGSIEHKHYKFIHAGRNVIGAYGKDPTGDMVSPKIKTVPGAKIIERLDDCVDSAIPVVEQGQFVNDSSKVVKYRSCMIPFSSSQGGVSHILIGLSWREF